MLSSYVQCSFTLLVLARLYRLLAARTLEKWEKGVRWKAGRLHVRQDKSHCWHLAMATHSKSPQHMALLEVANSRFVLQCGMSHSAHISWCKTAFSPPVWVAVLSYCAPLQVASLPPSFSGPSLSFPDVKGCGIYTYTVSAWLHNNRLLSIGMRSIYVRPHLNITSIAQATPYENESVSLHVAVIMSAVEALDFPSGKAKWLSVTQRTHAKAVYKQYIQYYTGSIDTCRGLQGHLSDIEHLLQHHVQPSRHERNAEPSQ